jgi:menaquinone-dependent protoporphyrinogen IX oxidase
MTKALIFYGTRYGAAASTSEEIANVLRKEGLEVRVVNAKEEKIRDIAEYDLVVVGSGIQINKWTGEPEDFLKKFQKELARKKVVLFVCCGSASQAMADQPDGVAEAKRNYLEEKAAKYNLQPVALGLFGGVYDFNKWPWWISGQVKAVTKQKLDAAGFKETEPEVYDMRDWNAIRSWAKELAQHFRS